MSDMALRLKGNTNKGKQRVKEHGEWWVVKDLASPKVCNGEPAYLIRPKSDDVCSDIRWILVNGDKDFEIIEKRGELTIEL